MRYGEKIQKLIDARGISIRTLAKHTGFKATTVGRWINGTQFPRLADAVKLAEYFGVSLDDMVNDEMREPGKSGREALTEDERMILRVCKASKLEPDQALQALIFGAKAIANGFIDLGRESGGGSTVQESGEPGHRNKAMPSNGHGTSRQA